MKKIILTSALVSLALSCSRQASDNNVENPISGSITPVVQIPNVDTNNIITSELRIPYYNASRGKDINIYGEIKAPKGYENAQLPLVILSPGFGNSLHLVANYAEAIAKMGFVVYSLEFYGGNHGSRSGGQMTEMSPFTEADDLTAVLNTLREKSFVDSKNIFLAGFSQGGVVSAITATENPDKVRGAIFMNAAFVLFDDAKSLFQSPNQIPDLVDFRGNRLGKIYFEKSISYDIYEQMPKFANEVLVIQGDSDNIVSLRYAERAKNTFPKADLRVIVGGGHMFSAHQNATFFPFINDYLKRNIVK